MSMQLEVIETFLKHHCQDESRVAVAATFGYADSRMLVFLRETYGLPLSLAAKQVAAYGLKVDFRGLRHELERMGKKADTIESELNEVRFALGEPF